MNSSNSRCSSIDRVIIFDSSDDGAAVKSPAKQPSRLSKRTLYVEDYDD